MTNGTGTVPANILRTALFEYGDNPTTVFTVGSALRVAVIGFAVAFIIKKLR